MDPEKNIHNCDNTSAEYEQVMWCCDRLTLVILEQQQFQYAFYQEQWLFNDNLPSTLFWPNLQEWVLWSISQFPCAKQIDRNSAEEVSVSQEAWRIANILEIFGVNWWLCGKYPSNFVTFSKKVTDRPFHQSRSSYGSVQRLHTGHKVNSALLMMRNCCGDHITSHK